jgi:predicted nucleotidyltransferase
MKTAIPLPVDRIVEICRKHDVTRLEVFGSVLRQDFRSDSDVDFLVTFRDNDSGPWMGKFQDVQDELSRLLGRSVDVVERESVERSENYIRRSHILKSAEPLYVER